MSQNDDGRALLVDLLHEASQLEHCLLDAYLYTACSLKSTPQELATVGNGQENRRRAIQFERLRAWKQSMLLVAHEEMMHLHYVQCMIRALGEPPSFALPQRDPESGSWFIPGWAARIAGEPVDEGGVEIPIEPLSEAAARRFVVYESTDAMQDEDPFGPASTALFERLHAFEVDLRFESMLFDVEDSAEREQLKTQLADLYGVLTPVPAPEKVAEDLRALAVPELPTVDQLHFQSIADFYEQGILPLYHQAFDFGWVTHNNLNLSDELLDPNYAGEGFLPIGPINRDKNFESFESTTQPSSPDPLRHYENVATIVKNIVEEGEGNTNFESQAEALLAHVERPGGAREYLENLKKADDPSLDWMKAAEFTRESHLYRFAMVLTELKQERELAARAGVEFEPARQPVAVDDSVALRELTDELPAQFNACYLVLIMWLSRIYEIREWNADRPRRQAIEMLASWPLMSVAIRPFLELASFVPVDVKQLFRLEGDALPMLPVHAQQLFQLYAGAERSEEINERMDYLAVRALGDAAAWARAQSAAIADAPVDPHARMMMVRRLDELGHLDEFERQYPYRVHGGYSNERLPDLGYVNAEEDRLRFEEDPYALGAADGQQRPVFKDSLALRLRFTGRAIAQHATDPDPPEDEAGTTGTLMLHAADAPMVLTRSLVWQPGEHPEEVVHRGPRDTMPPLGVNAVEVALMVTDPASGEATAAYSPSSMMNSVGAVQTSGVQQDLFVTGLNPLLAIPSAEVVGEGADIRVELCPKGDEWPYYNGYNHLVWRDGEPIDPFVLKISAGDAAIQREVFNDGGTPLMAMTPLQRLLSQRGGQGFDLYPSIPDWALSDDDRAAFLDAGYPGSYLAARAVVLKDALGARLKDRDSELPQAWVDDVVSLAERLKLISVPRGTTRNWLKYLLHHAHTVSGALDAGDPGNPILAALSEQTGLSLAVADGTDRHGPNMRWIARYTEGVMDTDALSHMVYGELYIPLTVAAGSGPVKFSHTWKFPAEIQDAVAMYACRFDAPFWADFEFGSDGKTRSITLPDGKTKITETLVDRQPEGYRYAMTVAPAGISGYEASFEVSAPELLGGPATLAWNASFTGTDATAIVGMLSVLGASVPAMTKAMDGHFAPR